MQLTEKHIITPKHQFYSEIDNITFLSKNLYNKANWYIRQILFQTEILRDDGFIPNSIWFRYNDLQKVLTKDADYIALPRKVSQQTLMLLDKNWKSFYKAIRAWKKNPSSFTGKPCLPKYKDKKKGRFVLTYTIQAIYSKKLKDSIIKLSGTNIEFKTQLKNIKQVRIVPISNKNYKIEVVYEKQIEKRNPNKKRIASIDIGVNNLSAVTSNVNGVPLLIINGRPLKSINQYFNKEKARLQSALMIENKNRRTSNQLEKLTHKRNCKIDDYLHKASKTLINYLVINEIGTLVIGKNPLWKQETNMGSKNNQSFISIPHARYIEMVTYKCQLLDIEVILQEESHSSKCSLLDMEPVCHQSNYAGKRIKRGMFVSSKGIKINADINGSGNIMRKAIPTALNGYGIEGFVVNPVRITPIGFYSHKQQNAIKSYVC